MSTMSFLRLPHPYPQIAEALNYNDDELAEHCLRASLVYGLVNFVQEAQSGLTNIDLSQMGYVKKLLNLLLNELDDVNDEMRKRLRERHRFAAETEWHEAPF